MRDPHHLGPEYWMRAVDDPGLYTFFDLYRAIWTLQVQFKEEESRWHCIARAEDYANGYREDFVSGSVHEPWPAMQRCYEMADQWME